MEKKDYTKRNLLMYPLGTVGRDMLYQLFNSFVLTYILLTRELSAGQLAAITAIMIAARIFDAVNDPIMGFIIEKTKTRFGKFKPWLVIGMITTSAVVITIFNSKLEGWAFVALFAVIYFLYSITYTMHDISYWGMIPSLSDDADKRNQFTSRAILFAGVGSTLAGMLIPMFTVGDNAIGGSAPKAYGIISIAVCLISLLFISFTIFGVKEPSLVHEKQEENKEEPKRKNVKQILQAIVKNKPLLWVIVAFILQQVGNGLIMGGIGSIYIYFQYGYDGGNYGLFSTIGVAATAILMVGYPAISRKMHRKPLMKIMMAVATVGYILMIVSGLLPASTLTFWMLTIGYMLSNFGQYGFYLVMMISILNTVEYNEYITGERDEAIIASVRPFVTKMASAVIAGITSLTYILFGVLAKTKEISFIEQQFNGEKIDEATKKAGIEAIINGIENGQKIGLLLVMVIVPFVLLFLSHIIYQKKYTLDEVEYDRICKELKEKNAK